VARKTSSRRVPLALTAWTFVIVPGRMD